MVVRTVTVGTQQWEDTGLERWQQDFFRLKEDRTGWRDGVGIAEESNAKSYTISQAWLVDEDCYILL